MTDEAPSLLRLILRELRRRKVALVVLVVVVLFVNLCGLMYCRGCSTAKTRFEERKRGGWIGLATMRRTLPDGPWEEVMTETFIPPWEWTADEWRGASPWR